MKAEIRELKQKAEQARMLYRMGEISHEQAKKEVKLYVETVNAKSKEIAKKYNQRPRLVDIAGFLR